MKLISIIVPVYNEEKTLKKVLGTLLKTNLQIRKEIIIVDDGSTDKSYEIAKKFISENKSFKDSSFKLISKNNGGKGSAVKEGIKKASGNLITIQDADLEYNPEDFLKLIKTLKNKNLKVVYGSRFLKAHIPLYRTYFLGNKVLSFLTRIIYNSKITDMETCYKLFESNTLKKLDLKANNFDIEPEITAKILKKGIVIKEVPISYKPRKISDGKKINWIDGLQAIFTLFYWKFKN